MFPAAWPLRHNPFYDCLECRTLEWVDDRFTGALVGANQEADPNE
jgi:hypothetical protein